MYVELTGKDPQPARSQNLWKYLEHFPTGFLLEDLERNINPLTDSDEYGIDLCIKLLSIVIAHL